MSVIMCSFAEPTTFRLDPGSCNGRGRRRSQFKLPPLHMSPIVTKVSVLSNLRISGCELIVNYCVSFILLFKTNFYR